MKSRFAWVVGFAVVGAACASSPPPPVDRASPIVAARTRERAKDDRLAGDWTTSLVGDGLIGHDGVPLTLHVTGSHVIGHFGVDEGEVDGEIRGNVVIGSWKERDGEGTFRWELSSDDKSFRGTFTGMLHSQKVPEGSRWTGVHQSMPIGGGPHAEPSASPLRLESSDPLLP